MSPLLIGFIVLNIVAYGATKMKRPAKVTADGMSIEATQAALARKPERFGVLGRLMQGRRSTGLISRNLVTAGLLLKPAEFIAANLLFLVFIMVLGLAHIRSMPAPSGFFETIKQFLWLGFYVWFGWNIPQKILQMMANKRRRTLEVQLADALALISSGLKGGYSFMQGLGMASEQLPAPINGEFGRVIRLVQLGLDTPRALEQMGERVNSYDYDMTISATNIQLSSGGNLSVLLEKIAETIRDRIRLRRDISALTSQGIMSGGILIALPIGIAVMLSIINSEYFSLLYTTDLGWNLIYLAVGQQAIGIYWIKKLLDFDN